MKNRDKGILYGIIIALLFVIIGTLVLYESNETLDMVAENFGFVGENLINAPFPEYTIPWFDNIWGALALGILSTLAIFAVTYGVGKLLSEFRKKSEQ
ncbi:MAG: hypothetical protein ACP5KV_06680 [Candidatus Methanomethylicaceae archaeon]